jgi:hypothetical protein
MKAKRTIQWLYYLSIGLMLVSLPFSGYYMSVAQFWLVIAFVLYGIKKEEVDRFKIRFDKITRILLSVPFAIVWIIKSLGRQFRVFFHRENAPAWIFSSILLFHALGLIFTTNYSYAWHDLRIKLPIFLLPLFLSTLPLLDRKSFRFFMFLFTAAVFTGTLISTGFMIAGNYKDTRDLSLFISHIRFSLLIDMAIFILAYMVLKKSELTKWARIIMAVVAVWMVIFLALVAYITGLVIFFITAALLIFYTILVKKGIILKIITISAVLILLVTGFFYLRGIERAVTHVETVDFNTLEKTTQLGNPYWHNLSDLQTENGHYVWLYVATDEMRAAWDKRSNFEFDGKDKAGQDIKFTLIRFLTSKGYRKDAEGVSKLTDQEVAMVENGIASIVYTERSNLYVRVYKILWEYNQSLASYNPSGHSAMQRLEFWKASRAIINNNWLTGVGTGDLDDEFQAEYDRSGSRLEKEFRYHSHNQFISILVAFGIIGLAWFLFSIIFPAIRLSKFHDFYFLSFFIIIMLSMLTEDTLETQAGVTCFAFFYSFYVFAKKFIDIV